MPSDIRPRRFVPTVLPAEPEPTTSRSIKSLRADLFEHQFPWPNANAAKPTAFGNNGRVEYRVVRASNTPAIVAVKLQTASTRSVREHHLLQLAQSPHVIALRDAFEVAPDQGLTELAFVMPAAMPLQEAWQTWTLPDAAHTSAGALAKDILSAVDFLHEMGIFHRDIKASNILMHENRAVLGDFGEAYQYPSAPYASLYRWADIRDSTALLAEALGVAHAPVSAAYLTHWLGQQGSMLHTNAVRDAFVSALAAVEDTADKVPARGAARRYQFWRLVQFVEKEIDSVHKKGVAMTVRQSMPQWNAEAYDKHTRPWAYTGAQPQ